MGKRLTPEVVVVFLLQQSGGQTLVPRLSYSGASRQREAPLGVSWETWGPPEMSASVNLHEQHRASYVVETG